MPLAIKADVRGAAELFAVLRALDKKIARKAMRAAVNEAGKVVLKTAKANVPVETGALKASLAVKVHANRDGSRITAIVGPRKLKGTIGKGANRKKGQLTAFGKSKAGRKAIENERDPVRYAHLVEFGSRGQRGKVATPATTVKGKKGKRNNRGQFVKATKRIRGRKGAQPFLRTALDSNIGAVRAIIRSRLEEALRNVGAV